MQDLKKVFGGVTLAAISGLAIACPPEEQKDCCSKSQDEVQTEVSFGSSVSDDADGAVLDWVGDLGAQEGPETRELKSESIQVMIEDGELTVIRNGKKLPASAYKRDGNHLVFLGEDGGEHNEFVAKFVADDDEGLHFSGPDDDDHEDLFFAGEVKQPPVMIGIRMGEPDEALRAQLGLGDRKVIMIDDVLDGLPADQAGLRKYDIVVAVDGDDDDVTISHLSDILMHKKPGDELKFHVIRGGEKETVRIKLRAYSAKDLGSDVDADEQIIMEEFHGGANAAEHEARLAELTERLAEAGLEEEQIEKLTRQLEETMERAMRGARGKPGQFAPEGDFSVETRVAPNGRVTLVPGPKGRDMFEFRVPGGQNLQVPESMRRRFEVQRQGSGDLEQRMEALERRMDEVSSRLEERMARMIDHLEKLTNRIEKSLDDR